MIYCEQPLFVLCPILLLLWQIFTYWLKKQKQISSLADTALTGVGAVGHAVAIALILLCDGTLSDVLLLVLFSGTVALLLSPTPGEAADKAEEERP